MSNEENEIEMPTLKEADEKNGVGVKVVNGVDGGVLQTYCERIERIEEQKKALQNDIKFIFGEAEIRGFDKKALKEVLKRRKMDANDARELDFSVEVYKKALGMD